MDRRLRERVGAWVDAGLISAEQATRIEEHERRRAPGNRRGGVAEAVGYVGAVLAVSAILLFVGELWDDIAPGGRLALTVLLAAAALVAGAALRASEQIAIQRLVSVLWLVGVAGTGWVAWVVADDLLGVGDDEVSLVVAGAVATSGWVLHVLRSRMISQLAALAGSCGVVLALLARPDLAPETEWWGLAIFGLGLAWALLGAGGWIRPGRVAEAAGTTAALVGVLAGSFGEARWAMLALGVVTAAVLVWLATVREGPHLLAVGALGLFVLMPQLVFELFGDAMGAPATLLVVGLLLVVLAVGLGRVRRDVGSSGPRGAEGGAVGS